MSLIWDSESNMICWNCGTLICKILNPVYRGSKIMRRDYMLYKLKSLPYQHSSIDESFRCCKCGFKPLELYNPKTYQVYKILN